MNANRNISPSETIPGGTQIHYPASASSSTLSAGRSTWSADMNTVMGSSTVPIAATTYIPQPESESGLKKYLPAIVGVVVSIVTMQIMRAGMMASGLVATGEGLTLGKMAGTAVLGSGAFATGNAAAQLTAIEMDMLPKGFNWTSVTDSALLGAIMEEGERYACGCGG